MCGLSGFIGKPGKTANTDKLRLLILMNETRGKDSTGIFGNKLMRQAEPASVFLQDANFDTIASSNVVICHTRYGTGGSKTKENAHPFVTESVAKDGSPSVSVVGTHNGWFVNSFEINKKYGITDDVDSRLMYRVMALTKNKKAFEEFEGPAALAYIYNGVPYIYKRDSRPLFIAEDKDGWYYSSIEASLSIAGLTSVKEVANDLLFRFENGKIYAEKTKSTRLTFQKDVNSYNWKTGVPAELVEELTGEKKYVHPTYQKSTMDGESLLEQSKLASAEMMKKFGEKLSDIFKDTFIKNFSGSYAKYIKIYPGVDLISMRKGLNTFDEQDKLSWEDTLNNMQTGGLAVSKSISIFSNTKNVDDKTTLSVKIIGYSEMFSRVVELDTSKFFIALSGLNKHTVFTGEEDSVIASSYIDEMFLPIESKISRTINIYPKFIKGVQYRCFGIDFFKGMDNEVEFYISLDNTLEVRNVAKDENAQFKNDSNNPIKNDLTATYALKEKNRTWSRSGQMALPFRQAWREFEEYPTGGVTLPAAMQPTVEKGGSEDADISDPPHRGYSRIKSCDTDDCHVDNSATKRKIILDASFGSDPRERTEKVTQHAMRKLEQAILILERLSETIDTHQETIDPAVYGTEYFGLTAIDKFVKQSITSITSSKRVCENLNLNLKSDKF